MKIQLDYTNRTITLQNTVPVKEFVDKIRNILPDWEAWKLETTTIEQNWTNPIIIDRPYEPVPWWQQPTTIIGSDGTSYFQQDNSTFNTDGVFCLDVK